MGGEGLQDVSQQQVFRRNCSQWETKAPGAGSSRATNGVGQESRRRAVEMSSWWPTSTPSSDTTGSQPNTGWLPALQSLSSLLPAGRLPSAL